MKTITKSAAALLATTALAQAGGVDRNVMTTSILFEEGTYAELSYSFVNPEVSGTGLGGALASGDMAPSYGTAVLSFHHDINDALSFSLILDHPIGADVDYATGTGWPYAGSSAEITSTQLTAALRYELPNNVSIYGGLRALSADGYAYVSVASGAPASSFSYVLDVSSDYELGYMLGAAYERPDIALRIALTYFSEIDLSMTGVEGVVGGAGGIAPSAIPTGATEFDVVIPQSVLLEAQSGIAQDTLLFGSIRWTEWTEFAISPPTYVGLVGDNLVDYDDDVWTFTLGVGHRLNDHWSVSGSVSHERETDSISGNLGPTDGRTSIGLGAEYTIDNVSIAGGVQYIMIGDAETSLGAGGLSSFTDNDAVAAGVRVGFQF